jgi:two-component system, LytTR family, sensor kinase
MSMPDEGVSCLDEGRVRFDDRAGLDPLAAIMSGVEMNAPTSESERARVPFRTVLLSVALLWVCYFTITTLRGSVIGIGLEPETLWRRGLVCLAGTAITCVMWSIVRLVDHRPMWAKAALSLLAAIPAAMAIAQVNQWAFAEIQGRAIEQMGARQGVNIRQDEAGNILLELPDAPQAATGPITLARAPTGLERWRQLAGAALSPYFLLLAWAALYLALLAGAQARAAQVREDRFRSAAKAAELRSLRYQVNPHFLFNTLNSLSSMVITGKTDKAEEMIQSLANFYRQSLADDPSNDALLEDEFDLQRHYLAIEAVRFPDRLRPLFDLPEVLADARVPGMILQPLVENSVKYGVAPVTRPVTINISAREEYNRLVIEVSDDGRGVPGDGPHGFGIGLANVRDRLEARFGRDASIASGPTPDGYRTIIRIPLVRHG